MVRRASVARFTGAAALAVSLLLPAACARPRPRHDAALLAAAAGLEGRLAGGAASRSAPHGEERHRLRQRVVAELARSGDLQRPGGEAVAGLLALADGDPRRAAAQLASAADRSASWQDRNDLAVALLESYRRDRRPLDLVRALDAARQAELASPGHPEVAFNLALALSHLRLRRVAGAAWAEVAASASAADAAEARRRLDVLEAPSREQRWRAARRVLDDDAPAALGYADLVAAFPLFVREYARQDLVGRWSRSLLAGDAAAADRALAQGEALGREVEVRWGDASVRRLYEFLRRSCDGGKAAACARAHGDFAAGVEAFQSGRLAVAEELLPRAAAGLREVASPLLPWAEYTLVYATFHRGIDRSRRQLDRLLAEAAASGDPLLQGRLYWRQGVAVGSARDPAPALALVERGTGLICAEPGDLDCAFGAFLEAEIHDLSGDLATGWERRLEALDGVTALGAPRQVHSMLSVTAQALVRQGYPAAAEPFVRELVLHAEETGNPEFRTEALRERGRLQAAAGDAAAADAGFAAARRAAGGMGPSHRQRNLLCTVDLEQAAVASRRDPARAVSLLGDVERAPECWGNEFLRLFALTHRAAAWRALGDDQRSEADLVALLDLFEEQRRAALDGSRYLSLVAAQPAFDELVRLLMRSGRTTEALTLTERSRNRFLLEARLRAREAGAPLAADEVLRRLPEGTLLVQFADLGDELVGWVAGRGEVRAVDLPLDRSALLRTVAELRHGLARGGTERDLRPQATELFGLLLAPLELDLGGVDRLVVVPDRALLDVPFAALRNPRTGRLLIEDVAVVTTPSSSLVLAPARPPDEPGAPLIVAAPDLAGTAAETLPPLAGAVEEGRMLERMFPGAVALTAGQATRSAFLAAAPSAAFIHFAGHALAEPDAPFRSRLPFAHEVGDASELDAAEIAERRLGAPLVVLAACSTLEGYAADRENLLGLAGAFYAAGSGAVVATLGPAEDGASRELVRELYRAWSAGAPPSAALRTAILEHRAAGAENRPLRDWANFVVLESLAKAAS